MSLLWVCVSVLAIQTAEARQESTRLVVTFKTERDNILGAVDLEGVKVVKQYGRRLVLDLGTAYDLEVQQRFFNESFRSVQSVEIDYLISLQQIDIGRIIINDTLSVTKIEVNATDTDVSGMYVSPVVQTPLWNLMDSEPYSIHVESIWKVTNSTPDVVVAVIDTGMAELAKGQFLNLLDGYDFISDDWISVDGDGRDSDATDPGDWGDMCPTPSWHGTKVASILAARHDNEWGMKGVAQNCSVMPVRVIGLCKMGYATDVTDAIVWAAGGTIDGVPNNPRPAKIISLSLAGQGACPNYLQSAITQAVSLGSIVVVAAGNMNQDVVGFFPANCEKVIAVSASTRGGVLAAYSNWGYLITASAPGGDSSNAIMTLSVNEQETNILVSYGMGTSFAAPHISGLAALIHNMLINYNKTVSLDAAIRRLTNSSKKICRDDTCVRGMIPGDIMNWKNGTVYAQEQCSFDALPGPLCGLAGVDYWCGQCTCPLGYTREEFTIQYEYYEHCVRTICNQDYMNAMVYCPNNVCGVACVCPSQYFHGVYLNYLGSGNNWETCMPCNTCAANYYKTGCGGENDGTCAACTSSPCVGGQYRVGCGGLSVGSCSPCGTCSLGQYRSGCTGVSAGSCLGCPANSYCSGGINAPVACGACSPGQYRSGCTATSIGSCLGCPANSYCSGGTNAPAVWTVTSCSQGTYLSTVPSANYDGVCSSCTANSYCLGGTSNPVAWTINSCSLGKYLSTIPSANADGACSACPASKYCLGGTNAALAWTVTSCLSGYYLSTIPSAIANGACTSCPSNSFCTGGTELPSDWSDCAVGYYRSTPPSATADVGCIQCTTSGDYCAGSTTPPIRCPLGYYCSTPSAKILCASTYYCPEGSVSRVKCPAGYYCPDSSNKIICPLGSYCVQGQITHTPCPGGYKGIEEGLSSFNSCEICIPGTYSSPGSSTCTSCLDGEFSLDGASECSACTDKSCANILYKVACSLTADTDCRSCTFYPGPSGRPPANADFTSLSDPACPWVCNTGYYLNTATQKCVACTTTSAGCTTGQYRQQCVDGGTADGVCTACTNAPVNSVYTGVSTTFNTPTCPYDCKATFFKHASTGYCCAVCSNGYTATGCTSSSSGTCIECTN